VKKEKEKCSKKIKIKRNGKEVKDREGETQKKYFFL